MRSGRVRESAYEWPSSFHFVCDRHANNQADLRLDSYLGRTQA
jgi:hypothetical protein